jgi:capsular polysaccharide biosynthesis protein
MNQTNNTKPITLKDLWYIFVQRIIIIALVAIITTVCSYGIARSQYKPQYASVATLYILRSNEYQNSSSNEISDELSLALKVVADCTYILKSRTVINHVIDELDLNTNYSQLYKKISTNTPHNTRILEVMVQADSPEIAKKTVDLLCEYGQKQMQTATGFNQVNVYEYGTLPTAPYNSINKTLHLTIGAAKQDSAVLSDQAAALEQENQELQEDIDSLGTAGSVVEIAQKLWDLVFPDTVVIEPEE